MNKIIITLLAILTVSSVQAQDKWSLERCIEYAIDNNIQLKQQEINAKYSLNQYNQSRYNLLPSLNASAGGNLNSGRRLNDFTGSIEDRTTRSANFGIGASVNLYDGMRNFNRIKKSKIEYKASKSDIQEQINNLSLDIAGYYLQVLLNKELLNVAKAQVEVTKEQVKRTNVLVESGNTAKGTLLQIKAQQSQEELQVVNLENNVDISLINLKQAMNMISDENFDIEIPGISNIESYKSMPEFKNVYGYAISSLPKVKSAELKLEAAKKELKIALGAYQPTLSASANAGTGYSSARDLSFSKQLEENNKSLGLSLSIPIFNKMQVRTSIKNARLGILRAENELLNVKNGIYKQIQTSFQNATASQKKYNSTASTLESTKEAFRYVKEKFNVGMSYSTEYNESKNKLTKVESDLLQAKYEYIFKRLILDFYHGKEIKL